MFLFYMVFMDFLRMSKLFEHILNVKNSVSLVHDVSGIMVPCWHWWSLMLSHLVNAEQAEAKWRWKENQGKTDEGTAVSSPFAQHLIDQMAAMSESLRRQH